MRRFEDLIAGYERFRREAYSAHRDTYRALAEEGQAPKIMVIGCCDSRVDPATIFDAGPGDLFILRNVANLVPPYEVGGGHHGTSAAIEFALVSLGVEHILILGHSQCGGIHALAAGTLNDLPGDSNIAHWMSIARPALEAERSMNPGCDVAGLASALEKTVIQWSLHNLRAFPFVRAAMDSGRFALHGAWFDIECGKLEFLPGGSA